MDFLENISLKEYTTFRIGGLARYFAKAKTIDDLQIAMAFAKNRNIPVFVLGGGSNILMNDSGFEGLVIKIEILGMEFSDGEVIAGAGENWDAFVGETVKRGLYGLENLSLIPGTVGAAPVQNIGAYGAEVKDTIDWVETFNSETGEVKRFSNAECAFTYRYSFFKTAEGKKHIITRVGFKLLTNGTLNTTYKDFADYHKNVAKELTLEDVRNIIIDIRTKKLPSIKEYGTAGSFFKNPIVEKTVYEALLKIYPAIPNFPYSETQVKIPAGWMLDNLCNFRGYREGDVGVYKNQALVIVNFGNAKADDIKNLAEKMIACVKEKTEIILEKEVEYI